MNSPKLDELLDKIKEKEKRNKIIETLVEAFMESDNKEEMLKELFKNVDEYKPLVSLLINWVIATLGPELNKTLISIALGVAKQRMDVLKFYKDAGLCHEDAMDMILDSSMRIERSIREHNRKK